MVLPYVHVVVHQAHIRRDNDAYDVKQHACVVHALDCMYIQLKCQKASRCLISKFLTVDVLWL
jgi:hypothetical protein